MMNTPMPHCLKALVQVQRSFKTMRVLFVLLGFVAVHAATVRSTEQLTENPIRRIVNLLQMMAKEIETDGEKDEEIHEKYICYCETNLKKLVDGVAALEEEIPQIEASIEEAVSTKAQLEADLVNRDVQLTQGGSRGLVGDYLNFGRPAVGCTGGVFFQPTAHFGAFFK